MDPGIPYFPYPYFINDQRYDGSIRQLPPTCADCRTTPCIAERGQDDIRLCPYGVNYLRLTEELVVVGMFVRDFPSMTPARKKQLRRQPLTITSRELQSLQAAHAAFEGDVQRHAEVQLRKLVEEFKTSREYEARILEQLKPEVQQALGQVHDYRQFVQQVIQNLDVVLRKRYSDPRHEVPLEELLGSASHQERAIYWAARLMESKLEAALFLVQPERIVDPGRARNVRLHGLVEKHCRIYDASYAAKNVSLVREGESRGSITGNPDALGVIPHTFIDNALKYAPSGSSVVVKFHESEHTIRVAVQSLGPRIRADERDTIFELFVRGEAAVEQGNDGTGFGLGLARAIARQVGCELGVSQAESPQFGDLYSTEFSATFYKAGN